jgi:hypothetical protein
MLAKEALLVGRPAGGWLAGPNLGPPARREIWPSGESTPAPGSGLTHLVVGRQRAPRRGPSGDRRRKKQAASGNLEVGASVVRGRRNE